MQIKINTKNLYGTIRYFPDCQFSRMLAAIKGRATLAPEDVTILEGHGYEVLLTPVGNGGKK